MPSSAGLSTIRRSVRRWWQRACACAATFRAVIPEGAGPVNPMFDPMFLVLIFLLPFSGLLLGAPG
jgi:hypothetical protein